MSDELKSDAKEGLPIRQNLVDTAVGFLLNPDVQQRPDDAKIAFLKKKGLTDSEIDETFNRVARTAAVSNEDRQLVNAYPLPPYQAPNSFLFQLRNFSSAFVSFAVAVYVLHRFYKSYIEPWLFGSKSERSEMAALKQQIAELNDTISQLNTTVSALQENVREQRIQSEKASILYNVESVPKSIRDVLDEMGYVKSLLLNRFSFPAPPPMAGATKQNGDSKDSQKVVTIPKWQMRDSARGKSKEESDDKEKSSSEQTSIENSLSSAEDQTKEQESNFKVTEHKIEDEVANVESENNVGALEDKNESSKESLANGEIKNAEGKAADEDSGVESHNYLSDSESTDQTSGPSEVKSD